MEMSLEVQLMNVHEWPSNIKRTICAVIEVNMEQLFLIMRGSRDQPTDTFLLDVWAFINKPPLVLELTGASDLAPTLT